MEDSQYIKRRGGTQQIQIAGCWPNLLLLPQIPTCLIDPSGMSEKPLVPLSRDGRSSLANDMST